MSKGEKGALDFQVEVIKPISFLFWILNLQVIGTLCSSFNPLVQGKFTNNPSNILNRKVCEFMGMILTNKCSVIA